MENILNTNRKKNPGTHTPTQKRESARAHTHTHYTEANRKKVTQTKGQVHRIEDTEMATNSQTLTGKRTEKEKKKTKSVTNKKGQPDSLTHN